VALVDSTLKDAAARLKDVTTRLKNVEDKFIASTCKEDLVQTKVYKIDVLENRMNTWEPQTKVLGSKVQSLEARVDNLSKAGAKVDGAKLAKVDTLEKNLSKASSKIAEVERKVGKADALEKKTEALEKKVGNVDAFHTKVTTLTTRVNNMDNLKADEKKFDKLRIRVDNLTNRLDALVRKVDNSNVKLAALDKGTDNTAFKVLEAEVKDLETAIQQLNVTQALGKGLSDGKFRDLEERIDQQLDILDGRGDHVEGLSAHVEVVPKDGVARRAARSETTAGTTDEDGNDTPSPTSEEWENADDIEVIRDRES
jgi:prefoldin subunit 5